MSNPVRPSLYTLPFGRDLCDTTVAEIFSRVGHDPLALSNVILLLPNNRAIKSMSDAFVRQLKPGLLLPRMAAVGDLGLDESLGPLLDPLDSASVILPAIEPMRRLLLLTRLVLKQRAAAGANVTTTEALRFAKKLAEVIDELEIEQIDFAKFDNIQPEAQDLAGHWQSSYADLLQLIPAYQKELAAIGCIGPSARRNILLARLAKSFADHPPACWIIAAGLSTAAPAVAKLLRNVAMLPQSMVILPSIDLDMTEAQWDELGPHAPVDGAQGGAKSHDSHPQFHLKLLLNRMGFGRGEVALLGKKAAAASGVIPQIFCLPDATSDWLALAPAQKKLPNCRLLVADDGAQEALAVAILIRKALEQPEKRVALITPNRELGNRVSAQLARWNIAVDDSAGTPLLQKPEAMLIMALAELMAQNFAPVPLLVALKHPLVCPASELDEGRVEWLDHVRDLDLLLRGPSEATGLSAIAAKIAHESHKGHDERRILSHAATEKLQAWWPGVRDILAGLENVIAANGKADLANIMGGLQTSATALSQGAIWRGSNGRALAGFFEEVSRNNLTAIGLPKAEAIPSILSELLAGQVVRPAYGGHPRVAIYGLLEARLQQADMLICGGLNEGVWPQLAQPDPWLAPRIRRDLRLPAPERNIGLSAHDLSVALGAGEVILTRAKRDRGGPTVASRFLLRIQALLGDALKQETAAVSLAKALDRPEEPTPSYRRPAPSPSDEQRKVSVSITQFDTLKANPYSFYASRIMGLSQLDGVDAEPSHAWRGSVIHRILELWHKEDGGDPAGLIRRAEGLLSNNALHPALRALWQPRIVKSLRWIAEETQRQQEEEGRAVLVSEEKGTMELASVKITGRADRIDRLADGSLAIVDYKSGTTPSSAQVSAGFALQLGLLGLMAEKGAINGVTGSPSRFEYWSLAKDKGEFGVIKTPTSDKEKKNAILSSEFLAFAQSEALATLTAWINGGEAFTAMLEPKYAYGEHNQLMRLQEWDGRQAPDRDDIAKAGS